jgi:hypothetical protein
VCDGRFYNDYSEESLREAIARQPDLAILGTWTTREVRPNRQGNCWIYALVRRRDP